MAVTAPVYQGYHVLQTHRSSTLPLAVAPPTTHESHETREAGAGRPERLAPLILYRLHNSAFLWTPTLYWAWPALCGSEELLGGCTPSRASAAVGSAASASSLRPRWLHISPSAFWAFSAGMAARDQEGPTTLPVMLTSMPMPLELRRPRCEAPLGAAQPHAHHVPHVTPLTHMCCLLSSS